jgi:hypothetical protein
MHLRRWFSFALLVLLVAPFAVAEPVTFTLTNGTDEVIMEFYASPPGVEEWEEDILGEDVLEPGESVEITIADGRDDCEYDFLAVFEDESELEHDSVAVCDGEEYVYSGD